MSRTETTAMLSKLVEKRLRNQTAFWASEVNFDRNTPEERRVDYVGFKPWNINGEPVPASVEKGCFEFYEVKSCMADFTSGNGLTLARERDPDTGFDRLETDSRPRAVIQRHVIQAASGKRNPLGNGQS